MSLLFTNTGRAELAARYKSALLDNVIPFWLRHGIDREYGGILTSLDRDGSIVDTDKSIWAQGRAAWMFATLYNEVEKRQEWLDAAASCLQFLDNHGYSPDGKMWFTVTREGEPLRMRRYVYSEAFAAIAHAAYARATGDRRAAERAVRDYATYLHHSFQPGVMPSKVEPATRPMQAVGPHMISINTAQVISRNLGVQEISGRSTIDWAAYSVQAVRQNFLKPELQVLLEMAGPNGEILDNFEGRTLNPGHAVECAWFIMAEGHGRQDAEQIRMGTDILRWMWRRGWDNEYGGFFYFRDLHGRPVQEYWHDMKFWWPHNEAEVAALMAWQLTGDEEFASWHQMVHDWSFSNFPDAEHGEWFGYLHRDARLSSTLKGNTWKGCFHLPRMLLTCWKMLEIDSGTSSSVLGNRQL